MSSREKADFVGSGSKVLRAAVGKRVTGIVRDQYFFNDVLDEESSGSLEVRFRDGSLVTLAPFDLDDDSHCCFERIDLLADRVSLDSVMRRSSP